MPKVLQILFVDNSDDDVLELLHHLRNAGHEVFHERVETDDAMLTALESRDWDIILCDYHLSKYDAQAALRLAKNYGYAGSFLVVSSAIGDELAVADLMKAGAHDLILKDRLERLVPAIERELIEAKARRDRTRTEELLKESEARLQAIVEHADKFFCLVKSGEQWELREVGVGLNNDTTAVITEGLSEGDVVAENPRKHRDLVQWPDPATEPSPADKKAKIAGRPDRAKRSKGAGPPPGNVSRGRGGDR